jgi:hypothetical protein
MIRVDIDGREGRITWTHDPDDGWTAASLLFDNPVEHHHAYSYLHPSDRYVKETGRRLSLTRLLSKYPRDVRKRVWEAYNSRA